MKNEKLVKNRLKRTKFFGRMLILLPYVKCVLLNGSLAQARSKKSSDIDILIIAKSGRIFTVRFFVNAFATILQIKRSKDERRDHSGKFCFNYFLTENYLKIPTGRGEEMDRYCADNYSHSKFIAGDIDLFNKFILVNQCLFSKYGFKVSGIKYQVSSNHPDVISTKVEKSSNKRSLDFVRDDKKSGWFERKVKSYQIRKIKSDPRTKKYPNLIVYNDQELRFHPPSLKLRRTGPPKAS